MEKRFGNLSASLLLLALIIGAGNVPLNGRLIRPPASGANADVSLKIMQIRPEDGGKDALPNIAVVFDPFGCL